MSTVRTLSRKFLKGHLKEGQPTFFIEKFLNNIGIDYLKEDYFKYLIQLNETNINKAKLSFEDIETFWISLKEIKDKKGHTIRGGNHFKTGDYVSIRTWFGKSYSSPQIIIAPDIEVKKVWDYEIKCSRGTERWYLNGTMVSESNEYMQQWFNCGLIQEIAKNDGLELKDFLDWFKHPKPFDGQIICWDDLINY